MSLQREVCALRKIVDETEAREDGVDPEDGGHVSFREEGAEEGHDEGDKCGDSKWVLREEVDRIGAYLVSRLVVQCEEMERIGLCLDSQVLCDVEMFVCILYLAHQECMKV